MWIMGCLYWFEGFDVIGGKLLRFKERVVFLWEMERWMVFVR